MAAYPSVVQIIGSERIIDDGTEVERSESGKPRLRSYYSQTRYEFVVQHECINTDKDALLAHYAAHKQLAFDFTYQGDNQVYSVRYGRAPQEVPVEGNYRWRVVNRLIVV